MDIGGWKNEKKERKIDTQRDRLVPVLYQTQSLFSHEYPVGHPEQGVPWLQGRALLKLPLCEQTTDA